MQSKVGIIRKEEDLQAAIKELDEMEGKLDQVKAHGSSQYNPGWHEALSLRSLVITSQLVAMLHYCGKKAGLAIHDLDFEGERKEWSKYNIVSRKGKDGKVEIEKLERGAPDPELERIARSTIEELEKEVAAEKGVLQS